MAHLEILAAHADWNKPEMANCTVVVPVPRRVKLPDIDSAPRLTFRLHREYLCAKSLFLRGLFSGASPHDLTHSLRIPHSRLPRFLPSPPSHPTLFLPVPDPSSIQPLFHWIYFGGTDHIENALDKGDIQWEGLARNVEYLGLSTDIKVFLGRWYRTWHLPVRCSPEPSPCPVDEGEDGGSDYDGSDSDSEPYYSPRSPVSEDEAIESDEPCGRGRSRGVKPLVLLCSQLRLRAI